MHMNTREIQLTQGKVAVIDEADFKRVSAFKWSADRMGKTWYAVRTVKRLGKKSRIYLHRFVMNATRGLVVDHVNRNGLDNRKRNLRLCTKKQNFWNQGAHKDGRSGVRGVSWRPDTGLWTARLFVNGKQLNLGCYKRLKDAVAVRRLAEKKHYGVFAPT